VFKVADLSWERARGEEAVTPKNHASSTGAPSPRANAAACLVDNKVVVFGGHGGLGYARQSFNDMYIWDFDTHAWEHIEPVSAVPEGRGGHSIFALGRKVYVYGGWNQETQFYNV
jgi:N-acetylneuraminic acid mutarotase